MAILKLLDYLNDGYTWIVDIDLEKFFDTVPQDRLMSYVHNLINDGDTESLIREYLQDSIKRFKEKLKLLTSRKHSIDLDTGLQRLNWLIRGWINYFHIGKLKTALTNIDKHLLTRLRVIIWKK